MSVGPATVYMLDPRNRMYTMTLMICGLSIHNVRFKNARTHLEEETIGERTIGRHFEPQCERRGGKEEAAGGVLRTWPKARL